MILNKEGIEMSVEEQRPHIRPAAGTGRNRGKITIAVVVSLFTLFLILLPALHAPQSTAADCDCNVCHGNHHGDGWTGCSGCHDTPPQTGTHRIHYDSDPLLVASYGDTSVTSTAEAYKFGCGNCHPLDRARHADGTLDVELYNANSPADSLKAKNPSSAAYTPGTHITSYPHKIAGQPAFTYSDGSCSNIYCHSGYTVTSGPVGMPLTWPENPVPPGYKKNLSNSGVYYIMDETCSNLTFAPYTVYYQRVYTSTPAWGTTGSFTTCTECHKFPLTTFYPSVDAAVGDSHQWVNSYGLNFLHAYNMGFGPLRCRTCHYGTVTEAGTVQSVIENGASIVKYNPVPLSNRVAHVNGLADVAFDTVNTVRYYNPFLGYDYQYSLANAAYHASTKTCSNVACHYGPTHARTKWQLNPKWGGPFRDWGEGEPGKGHMCDVCHRSGQLAPTCE